MIPPDLNQQYPHPGLGMRKAFAGFSNVQGDPSREVGRRGGARVGVRNHGPTSLSPAEFN